jgi:hypothetical protein
MRVRRCPAGIAASSIIRRRSSRSASARVIPSPPATGRFGPSFLFTRTGPTHHEPYQLSPPRLFFTGQSRPLP